MALFLWAGQGGSYPAVPVPWILGFNGNAAGVTCGAPLRAASSVVSSVGLVGKTPTGWLLGSNPRLRLGRCQVRKCKQGNTLESMGAKDCDPKLLPLSDPLPLSLPLPSSSFRK